MLSTLTPKQVSLINRAETLFKDSFLEKKELIVNKVKRTPDIELVDYTDDMIKLLLNDVIFDSNLFKKCIIPPFSVLDTKQGEWRKRKQLLDNYLGQSLSGRQDNLVYTHEFLKVRENDNGTSQFDSLLCELILKWFGMPGCKVYDCFAGGHVRGSMSALLGYEYLGIELATDQVEANLKRYGELGLKGATWINDDSLNADKYVDDNSVDLFFSCPPYGDLEKYTDDPRDLSSMDYKDFLVNYTEIIRKGLNKLKNNRFAVFVVGDFRDEAGFYRSFVGDTIQAFKEGGVGLYNELILLNNIGTAPIRASSAFNNRKMIKLHQNVLIFFKGDPKTIQDTYSEIDSSLPIDIPEQGSLF